MRQPFDSWSLTHLFGSFFLVAAVHWILPTYPIMASASIALTLGIIWECLDDKLGKERHIKFFDGRGFSWGDIACNFIGCFLAVVII